MGIKLAKKEKVSIKPKAAQASAEAEMQEVAQRYMELEAKVSKFKATIMKEADELKAQLVDYVNETCAEGQEKEFVLPKGTVKVGKRKSSRALTDKTRAIELLGEDVFMKIASITMTDLDKYLNPEELAECVTEKITNTRIVKVNT